MRQHVGGRVRVLSVFFTLIAILLVVQLYYIQIIKGDAYEQSAISQYVAKGSGDRDRGAIYFSERGGTPVAAAVTRFGWLLAIQPNVLQDAQETYETLAAIAPLDRERFFVSAGKSDDPYEDVAERLSDEQALTIRQKKLTGVILAKDQWRTYPAGDLAAQIVGFVGFRGEERVGVYGLERYFENTLSRSAVSQYVNPFAEIFSNVRFMLSSDPSAHKGSLVTSIEPRVQQRLQATLTDVMRQYTPEFAGGIVMDPHTGEIFAMAGEPSFDPNAYNQADLSSYVNKLVEGRYELGSIMKPLTVAAGIDSGAISATSTYTDTGCMTLSTYEICNFDGKKRGIVTMQEVLSQSLNVGAATIAARTGYSPFTQFLNSLGLAQKTGIDLPNEVSGDLRALGLGQKPAINYAAAAYGQGIAVSPIAMTRALSALANGGVLPNPHVVTGIRDDSGIVRAMPPRPGVRAMRESTADAVTEMLIKVFDKGLLKGELKQERYTIAAKTGTAQIADGRGAYLPPGIYLHSFFGYFPAREPRFIVFLFAYKPHGQEYASATLARPFMDIAKFLINYYDIPPDR